MNEITDYTHDDNLTDIIEDFDNILFDSDCDFWDIDLNDIDMEDVE